MVVNGQELDVGAGVVPRTLRDLIEHFQLDPETVAVEMNGRIPERETWASVLLQPDDRIELIRFVGGG